MPGQIATWVQLLVSRPCSPAQARTPLIGLVDVDMLISRASYDMLVASTPLKQMLMSNAANKTALVRVLGGCEA